jgi:alkylation response protein AidB-like acyl-CoA dehydrogenase
VGAKLADFQTIQNWIADSAAEIHGLRPMTLHAAWKMDRELDSRAEISMILRAFRPTPDIRNRKSDGSGTGAAEAVARPVAQGI